LKSKLASAAAAEEEEEEEAEEETGTFFGALLQSGTSLQPRADAMLNNRASVAPYSIARPLRVKNYTFRNKRVFLSVVTLLQAL
jgi:hypothetical protein